MESRTIENRVEILEKKVEPLELLPGRVDHLTLQVDQLTLQVVQLRQDMQVEFSSVRAEMRLGDEETRSLIRELELRLRSAIRAGDEETRTFMRVLYEDLVERIKRLGEGPLPLR